MKKDLKPEEVYEVLKDNNYRIEISKGDVDEVYAFSKDKSTIYHIIFLKIIIR